MVARSVIILQGIGKATGGSQPAPDRRRTFVVDKNGLSGLNKGIFLPLTWTSQNQKEGTQRGTEKTRRYTEF